METPQNDFQIYRPINDTWQAVFSLEGDIAGGISKNRFRTITFDWSVLLGYLAIWLFGCAQKPCPSGVSLKRALKMELRGANLRAAGHSSQKLLPENDFLIFPHLYPLLN